MAETKTIKDPDINCPHCGKNDLEFSRAHDPVSFTTKIIAKCSCGFEHQASPFQHGVDEFKIVKEPTETRSIHIVYHDPEMPKIVAVEDKSDWFDLRAADTIEMKAGEYKLISLGVSMKLPEGYEAYVVPRSSTFKQFGLLQTNSTGIIDSSFSGTNDIWRFPAYAMRDTKIEKYDRICQFRIQKKQPSVLFAEVSQLDDTDRGGLGSTGRN